MKIKSINPGKVFMSEQGWTFNIMVNGKPQSAGDNYCMTANAAKQEMRETVAWLRKHHGLTVDGQN